MIVFTITTLRSIKDFTKPYRTVGWFDTLERASFAVTNNICDIYEEGYYPYCVIEEIPMGIYPHVTREWWFRWSREKNHYDLIDKPVELTKPANMVNFGIG
jgi:Lar family restriction alleviation protein